jgi:hypothetical protein
MQPENTYYNLGLDQMSRNHHIPRRVGHNRKIQERKHGEFGDDL